MKLKTTKTLVHLLACQCPITHHAVNSTVWALTHWDIAAGGNVLLENNKTQPLCLNRRSTVGLNSISIQTRKQTEIPIPIQNSCLFLNWNGAQLWWAADRSPLWFQCVGGTEFIHELNGYRNLSLFYNWTDWSLSERYWTHIPYNMGFTTKN